MYQTTLQLKRRAREIQKSPVKSNDSINEMIDVGWQLLYNQPYNLKLSEQALKAAQANQYWRGYGYALRNLAWQKFAEGKFAEVRQTVEKYRKIAEDSCDDVLLGNAYYTLSCLNLKSTNLDAAQENALKALDLYRAGKAAKSFSQALSVLAGIHFCQGDYAATLDYDYQALYVSDEHERPTQKARIYNNIGFALLTIGETGESLEYLQQALRIWTEYEDEVNQGSALENLGTAYYQLKQYPQAIDYYNRSLQISLAQQQLETAADVSISLGNLHLETNDLAAAFAHLSEAVGFARAVGSRFYESKALLSLGLAHQKEGKDALSRENFEETLNLATACGLHEIKARAHQGLSSFHEKTGKLEAAFFHYKAYHEAWSKVYGPEAARRAEQLRFQYRLAQSKGKRKADLEKARMSATVVSNENNRDGNTGGLSPRKLRQAVDYIKQNLSENLTVEEVAASVDLNQHYFLRSFKTSTGKTPHQFLLEERVEKAKTLLVTTNLPLAEVAYTCGFSSQSHLTTQFRAVAGTTPSKYRQTN
jgi:AraC-like DNA-binding protein